MLPVKHRLVKTFIVFIVFSAFGYVVSAPWTPVVHAQIEQALPHTAFFEKFLKIFSILQEQRGVTPSLPPSLTLEKMEGQQEGETDEDSNGMEDQTLASKSNPGDAGEEEQTTHSNVELEDKQLASKSNSGETREEERESIELSPDEKAMAQFMMFGAAAQTQMPSQTDEQHESPALSPEERTMAEFMMYTASVR